jgi:large-conductance mechanosensitive channel
MAARSRHRQANQAQAITTGSTIRMETPKSSRQPKPKPTAALARDINPVDGFMDFLRAHAVVALATGFVIATQVQTLVKQLITSFIDPLFKLLFGQALSQRTFTLNWHGRAAQFGWGGFVYGLLDFIFVLVVIYVIIKFLNLDNLDKPKKTKE